MMFASLQWKLAQWACSFELPTVSHRLQILHRNRQNALHGSFAVVKRNTPVVSLNFDGSQAISRDRAGEKCAQTQKYKVPEHSVYSAAVQINFPARMTEVSQRECIREDSDSKRKLRNRGERTGQQEDRE